MSPAKILAKTCDHLMSTYSNFIQSDHICLYISDDEKIMDLVVFSVDSTLSYD